MMQLLYSVMLLKGDEIDRNAIPFVGNVSLTTVNLKLVDNKIVGYDLKSDNSHLADLPGGIEQVHRVL